MLNRPKQMMIPVVFCVDGELFIPEHERIPGIRALVALLDPRKFVNILPQVRKTFPEDENIDLCNDVSEHGLKEPPNIVLFSREGAISYINLVNRFWQENVRIEELAPVFLNEVEHYLVLADGERRSRAIRRQWEHGCDKCRATAKGKPIGNKCFLKHFPNGLVQYSLNVDRTAEQLFEDQMVCNNHVKPPMIEIIRGWQEYWKYLKEREGSITFKQFASKVGSGEGTIRKALNVLDLPPKILALFESGETKQLYGVFVELARLHGAKVPEERLEEWLGQTARHGWKVEDIHAKVSDHLSCLNTTQTSMFELAMPSAKERRRPIQHKTAEGLHGFIHYVEKVQAAIQAGLIGIEDSPFTEGEAINLLITLYQEGKKLPLHLRALKRQIEKQGLESVPERIEQQGLKLEETITGG